MLGEITAIARESGQTSSSIPGTCSIPTGRCPGPARCLRALRDLSEVAPVVVVAGNHDSPALLEALDFAVSAFAARPAAGRRARG